MKRVKAGFRGGGQGTGSAVFVGKQAGIFGIGIGSFWRRIGIGLTGNFQNFLLEQKFSEFFAG